MQKEKLKDYILSGVLIFVTGAILVWVFSLSIDHCFKVNDRPEDRAYCLNLN